MLAFAVVVGIVLVAAGVWVVRKRTRAKPEEPFLHLRCPKCKRRLRYLARQAGHRGLCPTCKGALTFPIAARAAC